jgi:hypothetical protein
MNGRPASPEVPAPGDPATPADIERICLGLPETEFGTSWGDMPTYVVHNGSKTRGFVAFRKPLPDAVDPGTGQRYDDLLIIAVPHSEAKEALVADESTPFFTIDHFRGYNAVLVQQSRLDELTVRELTDVIVEAWAARAPKKLVKQYLADG